MANEDRDQQSPRLPRPTPAREPEIVGFSVSGQNLKIAFLALITRYVPMGGHRRCLLLSNFRWRELKLHSDTTMSGNHVGKGRDHDLWREPGHSPRVQVTWISRFSVAWLAVWLKGMSFQSWGVSVPVREHR